MRKVDIETGMMKTRLVMAIGVLMKFTFGIADIRGIVMQSGPDHRDMFIVPPEAYVMRPKVYRKLLELSYGVRDAGREWLKTSDIWILKDMVMKLLIGAHQVIMKRVNDGGRKLLLTKSRDELLAARTTETVKIFIEQVRRRLEVGKAILEGRLNFNG